MKKLTAILSLMVICTAAAVSGCGREDKNGDVKVLKLAHCLDTTHPVHGAMEFMVEKVLEKSDGKLRVDLYPSGQLGSEREGIEFGFVK